MQKALLVSTVSRQFTLFDKENINLLQSLGYEVHCAANFEDATPSLDLLKIVRHHIDIQRSPFSISNVKAFFQLSALMKREGYDIIHCHAPMGGLLGRLCANLTGMHHVLYTAHGFHFYKGAPLINRLLYKNIERVAAHWTDLLLTMNAEDHTAAQKFRLKNGGEVHYIPGVGVDTSAIANVPVNRITKRKELEIPADAFLIVSIGELIERKNHRQAIEALSTLIKDGHKNIYYAICGRGVLMDELNELCNSLEISKHVLFLGYRTDVTAILKVADLFVFTSFQEGLPKSVMEAMASGLPVIATKIRGNTDLIEHNKNGFLVECGDSEGTASAIRKLYLEEKTRMSYSKNNIEKIKRYDIKVVNKKMMEIYQYSSFKNDNKKAVK